MTEILASGLLSVILAEIERTGWRRSLLIGAVYGSLAFFSAVASNARDDQYHHQRGFIDGFSGYLLVSLIGFGIGVIIS